MLNAYTYHAPTGSAIGEFLCEGFAAVNRLLSKLGKYMVNACLLTIALPAVADGHAALPSGREVLLHEMFFVEEYDGLTLHVAFLWPEIRDIDLGAEMAVTETDMAFLCQQFALPRVVAQNAKARRIVITFSDQPVEFGVANPEAIQVFESYLILNNMCEWEAF